MEIEKNKAKKKINEQIKEGNISVIEEERKEDKEKRRKREKAREQMSEIEVDKDK